MQWAASPNPDKKGNEDPKGKESKLPQAKTKKNKEIPDPPSQISKKKKKLYEVTKKTPD